MDQPEFLWITFRSTSHMSWFFFTQALFWCAIVFAALQIVLTQSWSFKSLLGGLATWEFIVSLTAIFVTKFGTINGPTYSIDCIWYNALMGTLYICLYFAATMLERRAYSRD